MMEFVVACPECTTAVKKESVDEADSVRDDHNDNLHGGDKVARVTEANEDGLNEFMDHVMDNFSMEKKKKFTAKVLDNDPWGAV